MEPWLEDAKKFEHENNFYLSSDKSRIGKLLTHFKIFELIKDIPGDIVECGVFKGCSLIRFATFRDLMGLSSEKKIYGFDIFGDFPQTSYEPDKKLRQHFIDVAGSQGLTIDQLYLALENKNISNVELIKGDILNTVPEFKINNGDVKISLLHIDTDIYEPAITILDTLFDLLSIGGVLVLDNYNVFPGETQAVNEFLNNKKDKIRKLVFSDTPHFYIKE